MSSIAGLATSSSGFPATETVHQAFAGFPGNSAKQSSRGEGGQPQPPAEPNYAGIVDLSQKSLANSAFSRPLLHTTALTTLTSQETGARHSAAVSAALTKAFVASGTSSPTVTTAFHSTTGHLPPKKLGQLATPSSAQVSTFQTSTPGKSFSSSPTKATSTTFFATQNSTSPFVGADARRSSSSSSSASSISFQSPVGGATGGGKSAKYRGGGPSFLRYYSDPLGGSLHAKPATPTGSSPHSAPPVILHTAPGTASSSSTTTVGYYVDNGHVVAVTNPDYNVEKTIVISSGKQQPEQGLNLSYRQHQQDSSRFLLAPLPFATAARPQLDLSEWVGHRVLARRGGGVYYPGVIAEVRPPPDNDLHILLDRTNESVVVNSPLAEGGFGGSPSVISDAIPLTSQVEIGSKVCVRQPRQGRSVDTFVEAVVYEVCRQPLQFLLKMGESDSHKVWVTRAALRLQEPPWLEELAAVADYPLETVGCYSRKLNS